MMRDWIRVHVFRFWTALVVLGSYVYLLIHRPEYLTWWKHSIDAGIRDFCSQLPYPWGDQLEATIGNFGIWVQLTLAILAFRAVMSLLALSVRGPRRR